MSSNNFNILIKQLSDKKEPFLSTVQSRIKTYIEKQGSECAAIVEKDGLGKGRPRTHHPGLDSYMVVLGAFLIHEKYKNHDLDSALSDPVAKIVSEEYAKFFESNTDIIVEHFRTKITADPIFLKSFCNVLTGQLFVSEGYDIYKNVKKQKKLEAALITAITHAAQSTATHTIMMHVTAVAGTAYAEIVALNLSPAIWHIMAVQLHTVIGHIVASTAFHTAIHSLIVKHASIALAAVMCKLLAAKYAAANAALMGGFILAIAAAGIIAIMLADLPSSMGKKVSVKVVETLHKEFEKNVLELLQKLEKEMDAEKLAKGVADALGEDHQFQTNFMEVLKKE